MNNKKHLNIRFYEKLNDFLLRQNRKKTFILPLLIRQTVKDLIESQEVPHTEVDLILVNGESVDFSYIVKEGDRISVYPKFESFDISGLSKVREKPLREIKFIVDVNLGKLVKYLRLLGFDTYYRNDLEDEEIVKIAKDEGRIILTKDLGVLKRSDVDRGYYVRSQKPTEQVQEVIKRFDLGKTVKPFTLCMECNGNLEKVKKKDIENELLPGTKANFNEFYRCTDCGKIYWKGSHYEKMQKMIDDILI